MDQISKTQIFFGSNKKRKHIDIKMKMLWEMKKNNKMLVTLIPSEEMIVDALTKPIVGGVEITALFIDHQYYIISFFYHIPSSSSSIYINLSSVFFYSPNSISIFFLYFLNIFASVFSSPRNQNSFINSYCVQSLVEALAPTPHISLLITHHLSPLIITDHL
ncbi:hypothetical protein VP01_1165g1 [Puccinia sorghi]|uniref:Uncharacterized protein n=1 Tax=Puccinia sorghi TaxID=27349 RepID=A0A0L6VRE6_9BASI|nr:hypothetical protein VP01_1165g1 [Puccinia sorghi]